MATRTTARRDRVLLAATLAVAAATADASFHLFRIQEIYSSQDGSVQYVELRESTGSDFESFWAGQSFTSTQGASTRAFTFPANLPSTSTANRSVLVATPAFAAAAGISPDFVVPAPFLFPGGGTINYAGVDSVTYGPLPGDGVSSVDRNGVVGAASPTNFAGQTGVLAPAPPSPAPPPVAAAEIPAVGAPGLVLLALLLAATGALRRAAAARRRTPSSPRLSP